MLKALCALAAATITGRYTGREFDAGPLQRLSIFVACLLALPLVMLLYPLVLATMRVSWRTAYRQGMDARVADTGLTVFSRMQGDIAFYSWTDIRELRFYRSPPITHAVFVLVDGTLVQLQSADGDSLARVVEPHGILVDRTVRDLDAES
jgi:hypothetical protein